MFFLHCTGKEQSPGGSAQYKLIWSDEFDKGVLPDTEKWKYDVGDRCPELCGWGNQELQYYTFEDEDNVRVEDGSLIIEARKEQLQNSQYTSGRLLTEGKMDIKYGRVEVRARLPYGRGSWPAIWMLPTDHIKGMNWPESGEIDIMEHVGFNQGMIYGTIHTKAFNHMSGTQKWDSIYVEDVHENYHVYAIEWTPEKIDWFVDDQKYHTIKKNNGGHDEWPFDKKYHLIINLAVGGTWGGRHGIDDSIWPQRMEIDYVRVYQ